MSVKKAAFTMWPDLEQRRNYSQAVRVGDTLYVSGTFGIDHAGVLISNVTMWRQIELAYENLKKTLQHFGATLDNVVSETVFTTSMEDAVLAELLDRAYAGMTPPARTVVQVSSLSVPHAMVQISCIARLA